MDQQYHPTFTDKRGQPMYIGQEVALPVADGVGLVLANIVSFGKKQIVCGVEKQVTVWDPRQNKRVPNGTKLVTWKRYPNDVVVF